VTYLKLIANAAWAGAYAALLIALLFVSLDADLAGRGFASAAFLGVVVSCLLVYVPLVAIALPTLFMVVRFFAVRRLTAHWLSLKAIHWFLVVTLAGVTAACYYNLRWSASLLPPAMARALRMSSGTMAFCTVAALALAVTAQFQHGDRARRGRLMGTALLLVPLALLPALLVSQRTILTASGAAQHRVTTAGTGMPRLLLIGIDAASMDQILPLVSTQRLPAFDALLREGASARLDTVRPCAAEVAWTALLTGTPPWISGVASAWEWRLPPGTARVRAMPQGIGLGPLERLGLITRSPLGAGRRRTAALWEILAASGHEGRVIGWDDDDVVAAPKVSDDDLAAILGAGAPAGTGGGPLWSFLAEAAAGDRARFEAGLAALESPARPAAPVAVRLPGLELVSRYFLRYHEPGAFGDVTPAERETFGRVLGGYYELLDAMLGRLASAAGDDALVLVVSPHGVEPLGAVERLSRFLLRDASGIDPLASGWWRRGPDGVFILRGPGIGSGARLDDMDLVDVVPTVLFAMGLPIGRDMSGDLMRRVFEPEFLERHTVQFVPAYPRLSPESGR